MNSLFADLLLKCWDLLRDWCTFVLFWWKPKTRFIPSLLVLLELRLHYAVWDYGFTGLVPLIFFWGIAFCWWGILLLVSLLTLMQRGSSACNPYLEIYLCPVLVSNNNDFRIPFPFIKKKEKKKATFLDFHNWSCLFYSWKRQVGFWKTDTIPNEYGE